MPLALFYQAMGLLRKARIAYGSALSSHYSRGWAFIQYSWAADIQRRALFLPILLGLGVGLFFSSPTEPPLWTAAAPLGILLLNRLASTVFRLNAPVVFIASLTVSLGFSLAVIRTHAIASPSVTQPWNMRSFSGRIVEVEPTAKGGTRLTIEPAHTGELNYGEPDRIRLSTSRPRDDLEPGDWVQFEAELRPLPPPVMPGGFDFGRKLWFEGVRGIGFTLRNIDKLQEPTQPRFSSVIQDWVTNLRHDISDRIKAAMTPRIGPLAAAFLTGERSAIDESDNQAMRDSSLAHLLSISGLHMVLAGFGFFAAVRYALALIPATANHPTSKKLAAACSLLISFAYLVLSGASVPTQRSFVSVAVSFVAIMADRNALNMRTVALGAGGILFVTPEAWLDPSFQMSFSAVGSLVAMYEWWNASPHAQSPERGLLGSLFALLAGAALTSLVAGLATAPYAAYHFNRLSLYGIAANVMVSPVVSMVIMPAGVLAILLMPFGLETIPLQVMQWGLALMLSIAHWVASWPAATIPLHTISIESLCAIALGGLWISIWNAGWRWLGAVPIVLGLAASLAQDRPDIMITATANNIAVRTQDGRYSFLSARRGRFDAEMWLRADGDPRDVSTALKDKAEGFECSGRVCMSPVTTGHTWLAFADTTDALASACGYAEIVVTTLNSRPADCPKAKLLIDRKILESEGAIAVYVREQGFTWQSVNQVRGKRIWATGLPGSP